MYIKSKQIQLLKFYLALLCIYTGCAFSVKKDYKHLIEEIEISLQSKLLDIWYPLSLDTIYGGFMSDFTFDWQVQGVQHKMIVSQARHIWTTSEAAMFYHDDFYRRIAEHGYHFLKDKMWDKTFGGFYMLQDRKGDLLNILYKDQKRAYGNAFAIYALSAYYAMCGDSSALDLAKKTFLWLDKYSYDSQYKGYFDHLIRDGSWLNINNSKTGVFDSITVNYKDFNSSIHLLEAFTELYKVWPDYLLHKRLREMLVLIRDTFTHQNGYLILYFERDWKPVSFRRSSVALQKANHYLDHISFGHDLETAYLMMEASHVLGSESNKRTLEVAKKMVDHSLANGWDKENGGFYYQGYYYNNSDTITIINNQKSWWVQAEGLNALLFMATLFPEEKKYIQAFKKQWRYINNYLIDNEHGGWYIWGLDKNPDQAKAAKGYIWKANYHNMRALINCIKMLRSEHELIK